MAQDWTGRLMQADRKAVLIQRLITALVKELEELDGLESDVCYRELRLMDLGTELATLNHFKESMIKDKEQQEAFTEGKRNFVIAKSTDILKKSQNEFLKKRANYPEIERLRKEAIKAEHGSDTWVDAIYNLHLQVK